MTRNPSKSSIFMHCILFTFPIALIALCVSLVYDPLSSYRTAPPPCEAFSIDELESLGCQFDQSLMLINEACPLDEAFSPTVSEYRNSGVFMNTTLHNAYSALAQAVLAETDMSLYISSAARDQSKQIELYNDDPSVAQKPRCSEHEAGLALDVYVEGFAGMGFIKSKAGQFVNAHCQEYGFIIRYPLFKKHKTGIAYEPWHIRYVGAPHAELMTRFHLTLEDYIEQLLPDSFYQIDDYIVSRQPLRDGKLMIPANCVDLCISADNTGCYILTGRVAKS